MHSGEGNIFGVILSFFILLQRNQAGSSPAMEFMGFEQCMQYLLGYGILIQTFISDRHIKIASHMKTVLKNIFHYFDVWHLKKSKYVHTMDEDTIYVISTVWTTNMTTQSVMIVFVMSA